MNFNNKLATLVLIACFPATLSAQLEYKGNNFLMIPSGSSETDIAALAATVTPSPRQLTWQRLETTAFVHFGLNTFYNQEWGHGTEDEARFNPVNLNTDQWAKVISEAGLKMLIMTCKHHDGFCMWPSKFTSHNVASSPWKQGKGDLVKEVSESCHKYGLKFGVYLSPWDRHEPTYGNSTEYNKYFLNQLTELLTNYGKVDEVWFDGACGEGPNGKKQEYDWEAYYALIRKLQPEAVIAVMGPDIRWVGTESGYGRETEWSVVPYNLTDQQQIAENSQQKALSEGFTPPGDMQNADLGSRKVISKAKNLIWYPSEVDVSIRPGWFWHESENSRVKTPEKLTDIYFSSVGRNSLLLLNIPPDTTGLIHQSDVDALKGWKKAIDDIFRNNLAENAKLTLNSKQFPVSILTDKSDESFLNTNLQTPFVYEFEFEKEITTDVLLLQENIMHGQRIEQFTLETFENGKWKKVTQGTTVGFKRLIRFPVTKTGKLRLIINESRLAPKLAEVGFYKQLPLTTATPSSATFNDKIEVELTSDEKDALIYYTTNGNAPDSKSNIYKKPVQISSSTTIKSMAVMPDGRTGFVSSSFYQKAKYSITLNAGADERYNGGNPAVLTDGINGSIDFTDGHWCGFNGCDFDAVIDLGKVESLNEFSIGFNESTKSWIFRPQQVEFLVSEDGIEYKSIFRKKFESTSGETEQVLRIPFTYSCKARYVKVKATNFGKLPEWHESKGEPAWLFVDEIAIQ